MGEKVIDVKRLRDLADDIEAMHKCDCGCDRRSCNHCGHELTCDISPDSLRAAADLCEAVMNAPVACHRTYTGKADQAKWSWIDGPASRGAIDQARLYGWRIENAIIRPITRDGDGGRGSE